VLIIIIITYKPKVKISPIIDHITNGEDRKTNGTYVRTMAGSKYSE